MLDLNSVKADIEAEKNGEYVEIPDWEGVSLGVRSLELPAYKLAIDQTLERYKRKYGGTAPPEVRETDIGKILATHILFGWKGMAQDYDADFALEYLSVPEGRNLAAKIVWAASKVAQVEAEFVKTAVKN